MAKVIAIRLVRETDEENDDEIGISAVAEIEAAQTTQIIRSPGVWGIEANVDDEYADQVAEEEYEELVAILEDLGIEKVPPFEKAEWSDEH